MIRSSYNFSEKPFYYNIDTKESIYLTESETLQDYFNKNLKVNRLEKKNICNLVFSLEKRVYSSVAE